MTVVPSETLSTAMVVCGKFHYFNYVDDLADRGVLQQFLYSHRLGAGRRFRGRRGFSNLFLKEYLFQAHSRFLGHRLTGELNPFYHWQWDLTAAALLREVDILHFLMHGNCKHTLRKARKTGAITVGEAVNSHPTDYLEALAIEHADLGLPGNGPRPKFVNRILEEIPLADRILVPSNFVRDSYVSNGVDPAKIHKIPYGANLADFVPGRNKQENFRVICVGQVALRKGHQYLLRAWKKLRLPGAELHCFGFIDPTVLKALRKIGTTNVFFHGSVDKNRLIREMQRSSAFLLPSVEEGFAVSILEGLACGIPVLTTTNSGASGVITNGKDGLLVEARSVEGLCENLERLYRDEEYRLELGRNGRSLVEGRFNWKSYVDGLVSFYKEVLTTQE